MPSRLSPSRQPVTEATEPYLHCANLTCVGSTCHTSFPTCKRSTIVPVTHRRTSRAIPSWLCFVYVNVERRNRASSELFPHPFPCISSTTVSQSFPLSIIDLSPGLHLCVGSVKVPAGRLITSVLFINASPFPRVQLSPALSQ